MTNPNLGAGTDARAGEPAKSSLPAAEAASELEALPIAGFQGTPEEIERQWRVAEAPADQVHQALSIRTPRWPCAGDPHAEHEDAHTAAGKARGATWAEWYGDRHIRFGIPVNEYTKRLWELYPECHPTLKPGDVLRDATGAVIERGPEEER